MAHFKLFQRSSASHSCRSSQLRRFDGEPSVASAASKESSNRRPPIAADHRDTATEKEEELKREIGDLKMEVLRERQMNKGLMFYGVIEMLLEAALMFRFSGFLFGIAVGHGASSVWSY